MDDKILTVRSESLMGFMMDNLTNPVVLKSTSPFHLLQDSLIVKKGRINVGDRVVFVLNDKIVNDKYVIEHTYYYNSFPYDDISIRLELANFEVSRVVL